MSLLHTTLLNSPSNTYLHFLASLLVVLFIWNAGNNKHCTRHLGLADLHQMEGQ
jgi:hypothetical protein